MKKLISILPLKNLMAAMLITLVGCQVDVYHEPPCYNGVNGRNGNAFIELNYSNIQPTYIWGNNAAFPWTFNYGSYYYSNPGSYQLYYEGHIYQGDVRTDYYWDVTYDIWIHYGTSGGPCYNGSNGVDSYLTLWLDPYGPGVERFNKKGETVELIKSTADEIVLEVKTGEGGMKITYHRLQESRKAELGAGMTVQK